MRNPPTLLKDGKYLINGKLYPRLSDVLASDSIGLRRWKEKMGYEEAERIAEETSEWGTKVHLVTALNDKRDYKKMMQMIHENSSLLPTLLAWQLYVSEYITKWIAVEEIVWSDKLMVAGRVDRVGIIKGDTTPSILDIKTGSLYDDIGVRLAGYLTMWNERSRKKAKRYLAIQLPRLHLGEIKPKEYTHPRYENKFVEACEAYRKMYG
jgi:hypothetical protein